MPATAKRPDCVFVPKLTLANWLVSIWPALARSRPGQSARECYCYVIDSPEWLLELARAMGGLFGWRVERLIFHLIDIRDADGKLLSLRIAYQDLETAYARLITKPVLREFLSAHEEGRLPLYLLKQALSGTTSLVTANPASVGRRLYLIQICVWKMKLLERKTSALFLERHVWLEAVAEYAAQYEIDVVPIARTINWKTSFRKLAGTEVRWALNVVRQIRRGNWRVIFPSHLPRYVSERPMRVALQCYGHFNLAHPELHSDFFFWQQSSLPGRNLLTTFALPSDPLTKERYAELARYGITAVALNPKATSLPNCHVFTHFNFKRRLGAINSFIHCRCRSSEEAWLSNQAAVFRAKRQYWIRFFDTYNVKIYTTWYKNDAEHLAIADALQSLGGVTAIYQRSFESDPSVDMMTAVDILFSFSKVGAHVEARSNSIIPYHVTTGYLGDHRFHLLRSKARVLREKLLANGARYILAYFDENSHSDSRWHPGHESSRQGYAFLLEKALANPGLGLIFKPKTPKTLWERLGPVAELMEQALATGRCFLYGEGTIQSTTPPAEAALASDLAIHGHLCAATAGMEAALAGIRTLLIDREGWPVSPLYQLGVGKVVFCSWPELWSACEEHWSRPGGTPGFGDWSPMIDELDPFRDGRAAERMGTYLHWLIRGFESGLPRETLLADAAERYCKIWGRDKITEVKPVMPFSYGKSA